MLYFIISSSILLHRIIGYYAFLHSIIYFILNTVTDLMTAATSKMEHKLPHLGFYSSPRSASEIRSFFYGPSII